MSRIRAVFSIGAMHGGGSERQLVSLLHHIDRKRIEPHVYLVYKDGPLLAEIPDDVPVTSFDQRASASHIYFPGLMHKRRVYDMARYLRDIGAQVVYDRTFLMTLIAADAARVARVPNVSTIVTDPSLGFAPVAGRFQWWKKRILRRLYLRSSRVLANSAGAARSAECFYNLPENFVDVHYNGANIEVIQKKSTKPVESTWWNKGTASGSVFRIVTAGRLNREKGFHLLIDAVAELVANGAHNVRLAILGEGPGRTRLENQISSLRLTDEVRLMGFQDNVSAWMKSADVFVLPSLLEGMPNVLLESMSVETPVISTDCPSGPREILRHGDFGKLIPTENKDSIREALKTAMSNVEDKQQTAAARKWVESEFSIRSAAAKLEEILASVTR